jgi:hypothetical protein
MPDRITAAHNAVLDAEEKIAAAEQARAAAYDRLDDALAGRGWARFYGGFDARLYTQPGGNPVPLAEVLEHERRIAA